MLTLKQPRMLTLLSLGLVFASPTVYADEWQFSVEPYLMATAIDGSSAIGTIEAPLEVEFDTILNNLDSAFMLHFEGYHQSNWGFIADWGYMDLSKSHNAPKLGVLSARVRQAVLELSVAYRFSSPSMGDWVNYVGIRRWDNTYEFDLDPNFMSQVSVVDRDEDWIDLIFGFHLNKQLSEHWQLTTAGDLGGFNLNAKLTGSFKLGAVYQINPHWDLGMSYKTTYVDYQTGQRGNKNFFSYDTFTHGPQISVSYQF